MAGKRGGKGKGGSNAGNQTPPSQQPAGKEKFGDRLRRYAQYGQNYNNQGANMSTTQRLGGTLFNAFEQETLGKMGMLGGALSASLRTKKNAGATEGGSGVDTPTIPFQPIKGDDVVSAINQSTGQVVRGLNSVNTTMGRGFNTLRDGVQAQSQALNSIVGSNEDVVIQLREIYDLLDRMSFNRGGEGRSSESVPKFMGSDPTTSTASSGGGLLGNIITGALYSLLGAGVDAAAEKIKNKNAKDQKKTTQPRDEKGRFTKRPPAAEIPKSTGIFSKLGKSFMGVFDKAATPVFAAIAIWDAWEEIDNLDTKMDLEKYRAEVAKIVGKAVAQFGLMWVGGIMGGIIAGAISGPGAIVGFVGGLAGGALAEYALGDTTDAIVDSIVTQLYEGKAFAPPNKKNKSRAEAILNPSVPVKKTLVTPETGAGRPSFLSPNNTTGIQNSSELSSEEIDQLFKLAPVGASDAELMSLASRMFPGRKFGKLKERINLLHQLMQTSPQSSLGKSKGVQVASLDPSIGTSEAKLQSQEATAEEAASKNITQSITMNARDLLYKADKITFETDTLEFKFNEKKETMAGASGTVSGGGGPGGGNDAGYTGGPISGTTGQVLETIKKRESGGDYQAHSKSSSASGAYQFIDSTWQSLTKKYGVGGQYKSAGDAPPAVQDAVAKAYVDDILKENNGDVSKVPLVWYTGNAQGKMSQSALATNNGLTPGAYQAKWMNDFSKIAGATTNTAGSDATPSQPSSTGGQGLQGPDATQTPSSTGGQGLQGPDVQSAPSSDKGSSSGAGGGSSLNAFLDPSKRGTDHASGLKSDFASKLQPFLQAAKSAGVDLKIGSGYRSVERQRQLFNAAVQKYGSVAAARKWVAPPGKSNHNGGNAVDLWSGGKAISANSKAGQWAHANAGKYGLYFRMGHEPWHIEPSKGGATSAPDSGGTTTPDASPVASSGMSGGSGMESESNAGGGATMAQGGGMAGGGIGGADPISGMMGALGGGGNPLSGMMGALGGGGSPFGMIGSLMGTVLGALSSSTSMKAMTSRGGPVTANIINNTKSGSDSTGTNFPDPKTPLPAIDSMFARLFDGSSMFG